MNNEPVAWAIKTGDDLIEFHTEMREFQETVDFYKMEEWDFEEVPLYTHPADESFDRTASHMAGEYVSYLAKTLTDEEILKEAEGYGMGEKFIQDAPLFHAIKFARAILKKASEK